MSQLGLLFHVEADWHVCTGDSMHHFVVPQGGGGIDAMVCVHCLMSRVDYDTRRAAECELEGHVYDSCDPTACRRCGCELDFSPSSGGYGPVICKHGEPEDDCAWCSP